VAQTAPIGKGTICRDTRRDTARAAPLRTDESDRCPCNHSRIVATVDLEQCPAREQLRDLLGDVVDDLTPAQAGRILAATYTAARRELERDLRPAA
jgi:hypothetical protein